jgi:hypothetical protein
MDGYAVYEKIGEGSYGVVKRGVKRRGAQVHPLEVHGGGYPHLRRARDQGAEAAERAP